MLERDIGNLTVTLGCFRDHHLGRVDSDGPTISSNQRSHGDYVFSGPTPDIEHCVAACQLELIEAPLLAVSNDVGLAGGVQVLNEIRCRVSR
jgi:hypothetical protein